MMGAPVAESPGLDRQGYGKGPTAEVEGRGRAACQAGTGPALTFFIRKDSSSSLSTAKMFSMGMLQRG